jgi:signal transduction histidine kinase
MVVLALGLAVAGIVQAMQQARSLAFRLMAPLEVLARTIADTARSRFDQELQAGLNEVAEFIRSGSLAPWEPSERFPGWLDGLYAWNGRNLSVLSQPKRNGPGLTGFARAQLSGRWGQQAALPADRPDLVYGTVDGVSAVLACRVTTDAAGDRLIVAAGIDLELLRTDLVETMLPAGSGLELVRAHPDTPGNPWSQRLYSAMRFWAIQPTEAFVTRQKRAVIGQTLVHLVLTLLALATLLIAMWVLVRVLRREMALAELKANFVADVSHELKTPLALIRLFGETLLSGRVVDETKRREYYGVIIRESTRLAGLIDNILDFARIEAGRKEYTLDETDVAEVVRETYKTYQPQLDDAGFEHELAVDENLPPVRADRGAIAQALINLVNNAIKYSREERYLAIDVSKDTRRGKRGVLISVHDRGIGIRPADRAHLFDGFFRASDPRVREAGGAGMGLSLVKRIVDIHSGSLDVESRLVKGSTFRIFLPAMEQGIRTHEQAAEDRPDPEEPDREA